MFEAAMTGHFPPNLVLSKRFLMRRLRAASFFCMLMLTRKPSMT